MSATCAMGATVPGLAVWHFEKHDLVGGGWKWMIFKIPSKQIILGFYEVCKLNKIVALSLYYNENKSLHM